MAKAKICDRCGNVYGKNDYTADFGPRKYGIVKGVCVMYDDVPPDGKNAYMDLCDDCAKQLTIFLQNKEIVIDAPTKARW